MFALFFDIASEQNESEIGSIHPVCTIEEGYKIHAGKTYCILDRVIHDNLHLGDVI